MGGKLKTNKSTAKRLRRTKSGKFKKSRAGRRHLLKDKSRSRKRHMRRRDLVSDTMTKHIRRLMPYA
jgi:large subunit ribosomal protein L35